MTKKPARAPLTSASIGALQSRKLAPAAPASAPPEPVQAPLVPEAPRKKDTRVQVLVRMEPHERKALRKIALDKDTTVQELVEQGIRDIIKRHTL